MSYFKFYISSEMKQECLYSWHEARAWRHEAWIHVTWVTGMLVFLLTKIIWHLINLTLQLRWSAGNSIARTVCPEEAVCWLLCSTREPTVYLKQHFQHVCLPWDRLQSQHNNMGPPLVNRYEKHCNTTSSTFQIVIVIVTMNRIIRVIHITA